VPPPSHLTSCTPTKSNLYLVTSLEIVIREPALYKLLTFHNTNLVSIFRRLGRLSKESVQVRGSIEIVVTNLFVYGEGLSVPRWRTSPCHLSAAAYSIYSQLPSTVGDRSSIRKLRKSHAVPTGTHPTWIIVIVLFKKNIWNKSYRDPFSLLQFPAGLRETKVKQVHLSVSKASCQISVIYYSSAFKRTNTHLSGTSLWHKISNLLTRYCMVNYITARFWIRSAVFSFLTSCRFHTVLATMNERRLQRDNKVSRLEIFCLLYALHREVFYFVTCQ
jgi:hypothetical protein